MSQVELTSGDTPFARWGDLPAAVVLGVVLAISADGARHGRTLRPSGGRDLRVPPRARRRRWP